MIIEDKQMGHEFYERFPEITIPETIKNLFAFSDGIDKLPLNKINIFIGPNNSGKSYFIREVLKNLKCITYYNPLENPELLKLWESKVEIYQSEFKKVFDNSLPAEIQNKTINRKIINEKRKNFLRIMSDVFTKDNNKTPELLIQIIKGIISSFSRQLELINISELGINIVNIEKDAIIYLEEMITYFNENSYIINNVNSVLITPYRGLNPSIINGSNILVLYNDKYGFRFKDNDKDTDSYSSPNFFSDFVQLSFYFQTGTDLYHRIRKLLLTNSITRDKHKAFEDFLKEYFFEGKRVSITPVDDGNKNECEIALKIGDDIDLNLKDVGTGLQMIMLLTWPLFAYDNGMIFIEEPELFLHPRFQNQLMNVYATHERSKNFQFFIVTHSNHIIDAIGIEDKINLFAFEKRKPDRIEVTQTSYKDTKPYELLGVKPSSIALANGIIWVEGPSDRTYVNYWINLFKPVYIELIEGYHYQILFYGGSLIKHLSPEMMNDQNPDGLVEDFIRIVNINQNFLILADSDKDSEDSPYSNAVLRIKDTVEANKLWITKGRTIENYLSLELIKKVPAIAKRVKQLKNNLHFDQFDHIVYNLYIDRLKYSPNTGFVKADFAKNIINLKPDKKEFKFDIEEQVNNLLNMIYKWNDIDPKKMEIKENLI